MPKPVPIDPLSGPKLALTGRIMTMDDSYHVLDRGTVYIENGGITAVLPAEAAPPPGFESVGRVNTRGTIFPGLIELHNHLPYNILQLWQVPKKYGNRGQWQGTAAYRKLISGPMGIIGRTPGLMPAVVRYVECKCLMGGTTTSQGIRLFSSQGSQVYYRGLIRNVEETGDANLPDARALIADPDTVDHQKFLTALKRATCYIVHLSEGTDATARQHFLSLEKDGEWAVTDSMSGIHCTGLTKPDFDILAAHKASTVWSPLSNLLLYGDTAPVKDVRAAGVQLGLGSDWSPSGSKNLLGELKIARLVSGNAGSVFTDRDLVSMVTRNAAAILRWDKHLGSIEPGKRADFTVIGGVSGDSYGRLISATETDIWLVMINGVARFGTKALMKAFGVTAGEPIRVGKKSRTLFLDQATASPVVAGIRFSTARDLLATALRELPNHDRSPVFEEARPRSLGFRAGEPPVWFLALDEIADTGMDLRPHLPFQGRVTAAPFSGREAAVPRTLVPLELDPPTAADDPDFLERLRAQPNLPEYIKEGLK
jgi:hypothetical protein